MRYALSIWLLLIFLSIINGQNLVKDPGFESVYLYTKDKHEHFAYKDWTSLSGIPMLPWNGAPDYKVYKVRSTQEFIAKEKFKPHNGNSYLSSIYTIEKNLYQGKLLAPLIKGKKYKISLFYKFGGDLLPAKVINDNLNHNMGILFSKYDMSDSSSIKKLNNEKIILPKHVSINTYNYRADNGKWKFFETEFNAEDNFSYIILGSFKKLRDKSPFPPTVSYGISWRIDDLYISEITENANKSYQINSTDLPVSMEIVKPISFDYDRLPTNDSISKYYHFVNKAEELIIDHQYFKALNEYSSAFRYKAPFMQDYLNAWKIVQDYHVYDSLSFYNLIEGSFKGRSNINFHKVKIDYLIKNDSSFNKPYVRWIRNNFNTDDVRLAITHDSILIKKINFLFDRDQNARISGKGIYTADSLNWIELREILKIQPELSELNLGNSMRWFEELCHHLVRYPHKELLDALYVLTMKGHFNNRLFVNLVDYYCYYNHSPKIEDQFYLSNIAMVLNTAYLIPRIDKKLLSEVNIRREKIYLEDVVRQQRKQLFYYRNMELYFFMYLFISHADEGEEKLLKVKDEGYINDFRNEFGEPIIMLKNSKDYEINISK